MHDLEAKLRLLTRGVEAVYSLEDLRRKLASGRTLRVKLGLDPTAPDIHLGHGVVLRKLRQFQDLGHTAVLVIGDFTARIGDPTGRDVTRPILEPAAVERNARTYLDQAGLILDTSEQKLEVRYNSQWLSQLGVDKLLEMAGLITVQQMLHRDNFKKRVRDESPIQISEFLYPIMQGYDSIVIDADVEMGGTDQTFNNLIGRQLMAKAGVNAEPQVVMVMPILAGLDGTEKMSKTRGNYVAVTDSADEMFGKIMSISDELMSSYFNLLTDLPEERIVSLTDPRQTHPRQSKDVLGRVVVESFHTREVANQASEEFRRRFSEHKLPTDLAVKSVPQSPMGIVSLIRHVGFASSNSEARRLVEQGGVVFDNQKVTDPRAQVRMDGRPVLRVGKRRVCQVVSATVPEGEEGGTPD